MFPDRYRIIRKLAQGGMAEVFLATDRGLTGAHRLVVIKRMLSNTVGDEDAARMFRQEARIAMQLNHPNVGHVFDTGVGEPDGRYYLVMEFIHGVDLRQILDLEDQPMPPALAVYIAAQVAAGLSHAHGLTSLEGKPLGVVHRDISPQNIRISHDGAVKLIDFGVAKAVGGSYVSQAGVTKGKFAYMAPEQVQGHPVDQRTDIFTLGNVLHEMLTYRPLFVRDAINDTLRAILGGEIPPPSTVARGPLSPGVDEVVLRALATDPEQRHQTAKELQRDLEQVLRHEPATATDLEVLVHALFGDAKARLEHILGQSEPEAADDDQRTSPAIPSRKTVEEPTDRDFAPSVPSADEDEFVEEEGTSLGYQRLSDDD